MWAKGPEPRTLSASERLSPRTMLIRTIVSVLVGAAFGFGYYRFIGCRSGACPIGANPYVSTIYGAVMGYFLSGGAR